MPANWCADPRHSRQGESDPIQPLARAPYECSTDDDIAAFADIVNRAGFSSPVRTPRGRDILAACGQLKTASEWNANAFDCENISEVAMEWKDVTPAGAKEKTLQTCCWLLSFYAPVVLRFIVSFGSLLSIEAPKRAFNKYAIMVGPCVVQGLLYLPPLILSHRRTLLMAKAVIPAL